MENTCEIQSQRHKYPLPHWLKNIILSKKCPCGSGMPVRKCCGKSGAEDCEYLDK